MVTTASSVIKELKLKPNGSQARFKAAYQRRQFEECSTEGAPPTAPGAVAHPLLRRLALAGVAGGPWGTGMVSRSGVIPTASSLAATLAANSGDPATSIVSSLRAAFGPLTSERSGRHRGTTMQHPFAARTNPYRYLCIETT